MTNFAMLVMAMGQLALTYLFWKWVSLGILRKEVIDLQIETVKELNGFLRNNNYLINSFSSDSQINYNSLLGKLNNIHADIMAAKSSSKKIEAAIPGANRNPRTEEQKEKMRQKKKEWWAKKRAAESAAPIDIKP